jgi:regulator of RNase E activity RraA
VSSCSTAELSDVTGGEGLLPRAIRTHTPGARVLGPAYTFRFEPGDNLAFHVALTRAPSGSILVAECGAPTEHGLFGALLGRAAQRAGLVGLVTDGFVRDVAELRELPYPVFAAGRCARKADKRDGGAQGAEVRFGLVTIRTGDLICADDDGVIAVDQALAPAALDAANAGRRAEAELLLRVNQGETTLAALGLEDAAGSPRST